MFTSDPLLLKLMEYRFPLKRGNQSVPIFLKIYYDGFIDNLRKASNAAYNDERNRVLQKEFYHNLDADILDVSKLSNCLISIIEMYDNGDMGRAYSEFNHMFDKWAERLLYLDFYSETENTISPTLYRVRVGQGDFSKEEMFHIPYDKREYIKQYRYSIAGYPCLYLASSPELCWYECGMPQKFSIAKYSFDDNNFPQIRFLDFAINPLLFVDQIVLRSYNMRNEAEIKRIENLLKSYILSLPLRAACSICANNKDAAFIPEYIIPQFLLLWIRTHKDILKGIAYTTCSNASAAYEWNGYNIVMPTQLRILEKNTAKI